MGKSHSNRRRTAVLAVILVAVMAIGGTLAYLSYHTNTSTADFTTQDNVKATLKAEVELEDAVPGDWTDEITNSNLVITADDDAVNEYVALRMRFVKKVAKGGSNSYKAFDTTDSKDAAVLTALKNVYGIAGTAADKQAQDKTTSDGSGVAQNPTVNTAWIADSDNGSSDTFIYYHKAILTSSAKSTTTTPFGFIGVPFTVNYKQIKALNDALKDAAGTDETVSVAVVFDAAAVQADNWTEADAAALTANTQAPCKALKELFKGVTDISATGAMQETNALTDYQGNASA